MSDTKDLEPTDDGLPRVANNAPLITKSAAAKQRPMSTKKSGGLCRNKMFMTILCVGVLIVVAIALLAAFPQFDRANERDNDKDDGPVRRTRSPTLSPMPTSAPTTGVPTSAPTASGVNAPTTVSSGFRAVDVYGQLYVDGTDVKSRELGVTVQLAGMSLFWSNNDYGAEQYYSTETVKELVRSWNVSMIRAAMGVEEAGGYIDEPEDNEDRVRTVVEACIDEGIYVIIDFHSHEAEAYESEALEFFGDMVDDYGDYPNVIYEIYNEPIDADWDVVKDYAETVIDTIRANPNDDDALILVGTPFYSQDVDIASEDPITIDDNVAYVLHFYAGTHGSALRNKTTTALDNGVAIFVSEFGTVDADGDGDVDVDSTQVWINYLDNRLISYANWAVNDKDEGASILFPDTPASGWSFSDYTLSGRTIKSILEDTAQRNAERLDAILTDAPTATLVVPSLSPSPSPTSIVVAPTLEVAERVSPTANFSVDPSE
eukprot:CAMPEP_0197423590 /NCGR_PEP_ID=MMETSP1170-20131217/22027_1 /TAXON_ID=54406 /ORGANISM="Sarcinochrysis sp, Strain CCMP770" /LENGTH=487 /DNA_ID=CAMNT_0042951017 /DNA_START=178 /DNA_END=1641 /DNA_ORIENTATION=+